VIDWSTSQSKNKIDRHAVTHLNERVDGVRAHTAWKCSDLGVCYRSLPPIKCVVLIPVVLSSFERIKT
jgi:hypothetical protein